MSQSSDFLRAFFQDNNLFVNDEQKEKVTEPEKNTQSPNNTKEIIHAPDISKQYASQKEINLKKMFWAIEIEEKAFIKEYKKEQKAIENQMKKSHAMPWLQQSLRNEYLYFLSPIFASCDQLPVVDPFDISKNNEAPIFEGIQNSAIKAKRGRPKKIQPPKQINTEQHTPSNKANTKQVLLSLHPQQEIPEYTSETGIPDIPPFRISRGKQQCRSSPSEEQAIKKKIYTPIADHSIDTIDPVKSNDTIQEKKNAIYENGIRISRGHTEQYISEQWVQNPKRISKKPSLFFKKLDASADILQKIVIDGGVYIKDFSTYFTKKVYTSTKHYKKYSQEKINIYWNSFLEKSKKKWKEYIQKREVQKKLYFKKKQKILIKKKEESLLFEKEERRRIEALIIEKENAKKQALLTREQQLQEWQTLQNKIISNIQKLPYLLEKKISLPALSHVRSSWNKKWIQVKEGVQIAAMVTSVFAVGTIGLSLPGWLHQYEYIWNADTFSSRQSSLESFVNNEAHLSLQKLQQLPVAGNENTAAQEILQITPPDTRIVIPKIAQNIPIVFTGEEQRQKEQWDLLEKEIQKALQDGVVHYPGTAQPGENGNVFITGHSSYYAWDPGKYKDVFAPLHNLEIGDEYYIYHNGKKISYVITERKIVPPSDVSVLDQDYNKKESTLMTCTPIGTAKNRLILKAKQKSIE